MSDLTRVLRLGAVLALAALLALLAPLAVAESADPVRVSSLCEPQSVIDEQDVTVTIKIYNGSQTDMTDEITLFGPDGFSVEKYAGLPSEQSVTYTGTWHVTAEQIAEGKINYFIRYFVDTGEGPVNNTRTIPVTIKAEAAAPQLSATYSISPAAAREGEDVTLSYTLSNVGNVELRNIVIANEGVTSEPVTIPSLSVGERVTRDSVVTMGAEAMISNPSVTYEAADSGVTLAISDMARRTITLAEDDLEVSISGENLDGVYPGEEFELGLTIKNTGENAYSGLAVTLPDGSLAAGDISLAAGASYEGTVHASVAESGKFSVSVEGVNAAGERVGIASNELDIVTQDPAQALILRVRAQAQETTIYSEPAVVRFAVVVDNVGGLDATSLTVTEADTKVAEIASLPSGESRTLVFDLEASIAGQFQFAVSGRDGGGNERSYESNVVQVTYVEPTPAPTDTPAPTEVPPTPSPVPTATPVPPLSERVVARVAELTAGINPMVLYGAGAAVSLLVLTVLIVTGARGARRRKRMKNALDTLELSPDTRNHRGKRRKRAKKKATARKAPEISEPVVPTPELTEEDAHAAPGDGPEAPAEPAPDEPAQDGAGASRTLRVAPVDQRPDFVPQGKVDGSATRVFTRVRDGQPQAQAGADRRRDAGPAAAPGHVLAAELSEEDLRQIPSSQETPPEPAAESGATGQTIRLNNAELTELYKRQQKKPNIKNAKPMKKKKKGRSSRRNESDDLLDDYDAKGDPDDDMFE